MARLHSKKKGKSGSKKPIVKVVPEWVEYSAHEAEDLIVKMGQEGKGPAIIGQTLRDTYGIPDIRLVTGKKLTAILAEKSLLQKFPEDMLFRSVAISNAARAMPEEIERLPSVRTSLSIYEQAQALARLKNIKR